MIDPITIHIKMAISRLEGVTTLLCMLQAILLTEKGHSHIYHTCIIIYS